MFIEETESQESATPSGSN